MGKLTRARAQAEADHRAVRRQVAHIERLTGGVLVPRDKVKELVHVQRLLVALVKQLGRVRITGGELAALKDGDSLKAKVDGDTTTLTYAPAEQPEEPQPTEEQAASEMDDNA